MELEVSSDQRLFEIVRGTKSADAEDQRARELYLVDFELKGGCALDPVAQAEFKQLKTRVIEKQGQFSSNIANDTTTVLLSREELDGLDDIFCSALEKTEDGLFKVTLRYPHLHPVLQLAKNDETRKKMWIASCHKAHPANLSLLPEIISHRSRIAQLLLGRPDASDSDLAFAKGRRMAGDTPQAVLAFLERTKTMLAQKSAQELKEFHDIKVSKKRSFFLRFLITKAVVDAGQHYAVSVGDEFHRQLETATPVLA